MPRLAPPGAGRGAFGPALSAVLVVAVAFNLIGIGAGLGKAAAHGWRDFFAFWSAAQFLRLHPAAQLYDVLGFHHFQEGWGIGSQAEPFLYPPSALLMFRPLAELGYPAAFALWVLLGLGTHVASLLPADRRLWPLTVLAALAAPATAACAAVGQIGLLLSALVIGGLRLARSRPLLGGALLGLASVKPQLALLVPVALLAARCWPALLAAAATAIALVLVSGALFGASAWIAWIAAIPGIAAMMQSAAVLWEAMPTVAANLRLLGAGSLPIAVVQVLAACWAVSAAWRSFRRGVTAPAIAVLLAGSFLCTGYALWFDLPLLSGAVILLVQESSRAGQALGAAELPILGVAFALPLLMAGFAPFPLSAMTVGVLAAHALGRATRDSGLSEGAAPASGSKRIPA
jgi:hypothetical protein